MIPGTVARFVRTDLTRINTKASDKQIISSLQGGKNDVNLGSIIFYPFLNPISSPGTNPTAAAIGSPDVEIADECAANCVAVLLSA
jgi:hypothetical protein